MKSCVLAIGKFEGIHLGHHALLAEVVRQAKSMGLFSAALVFEPHPYIYFNDAMYKPMFTNKERDELLTNIGVEHIFYCQFDSSFAALSPQDFCKKIFLEYNAKHVIVGENYRFGKNRSGDTLLLQSEALKYDASVQTVSLEQQISTSNIRKFIMECNIGEAARQLGFPFFITGIVTQGKQLGRTIGFPTLNVYPSDEKFLPPDGVYATNTIINGKNFRGITNIGLRPTVKSDTTVRSVETYLTDYSGADLYGEYIKVELLDFIRPELKFNSLDELKIQIAEDVSKIYSSRCSTSCNE